MESMQSKWARLDGRARTGIAAGVLLIVVLVGALAWWAYRPDYQVLFADLAPRDAAAMTAELDKMKTPYQLTDGGNTILVPRNLVYKTRLALMDKEVPLHGAVGFEVFNNADFGMTEFVQKVNYLRAVQGELTRTILSIENIRGARAVPARCGRPGPDPGRAPGHRPGPPARLPGRAGRAGLRPHPAAAAGALAGGAYAGVGP